MALFAGTFENKVDGKGRTSVPAQFRAELECQKNNAVYLYPSRELPAIEACSVEWMNKMRASVNRKQPKHNKSRLSLQLLVFGRSQLVRLEDGGRLVLPQQFRNRAGITDSAVFIGIGDTFIICNPETIDGAFDDAEQHVEEEDLALEMDEAIDYEGES